MLLQTFLARLRAAACPARPPVRHPGLTAVGCLAVVAATAAASQAEGLPIAPPPADLRVEYETHIAPVLAANCTACHNAQRAEGGLRLDSLKAIGAGGDSGPAAVSGQAAESPLFLRASHREEDFMPPPDNAVGGRPLTPAELGLLERWIASGLAAGPPPQAAAIAWRPLPPGVGSVPAVAVSPTGRTVAAARGGRVELFASGTGGSLGLLAAPGLNADSATALPLAHQDLISAIAFGPDDNLLATGSFRTIRLWQRQPPTRRAVLPGAAHATAVGRSAAGMIALGREDGRVVVFAEGADVAKPIVTLSGHSTAVVLVAFFADEQAPAPLLASVGRDGRVLVHRIPAGSLVGELTIPQLAAVTAIPGTDLLAAASQAAPGLGLWKLPRTLPTAAKTATPLRTLPVAGGPVSLVTAATQPADRLLTADAAGLVRLIDLASGKEVRQFPHGGSVAAVAVGPNGNRLVTAGAGGLKVWNLDDGKQLAAFAGDPRLDDLTHKRGDDVAVLKQDLARAKQAVEATKKALTAAMAEQDKTAKAVPPAEKLAGEKRTAAKAATAAAEQAKADVEAAKKTATDEDAKAKAAVDKAVTAAAAQEKAAADAVAAAEKADRELESARRAAAFAVEQVARAEEQIATATADLADTQTALAASEKQLAEATDRQAAARRPMVSVAFLDDGRRFAGLDDRGLVVLFSVEDGQPLTAWQPGTSTPPAAAAAPPRLLLAAGDDQLIVAGGLQPAGIWEPAPGWSFLRSIGSESTPPAAAEDPAGPPVAAVLALAFSPDGTQLASGSGLPSRTGEIKIWSVTTGSLLRTLDFPHSDTVTSLAFSRDGSQLASASTDRTAKLFSWPAGDRLRSFEGHSGHVLDVAWQADGSRLATAGGDGVVKIWEAATGEQQRTIGGFGKEVTGVSFPGVTAELLAGSGDGVISLINPADGKTIRRFAGLSGFVQSLDAAADRLVVGTAAGQFGSWTRAEPAIRWTREPVAIPH